MSPSTPEHNLSDVANCAASSALCVDALVVGAGPTGLWQAFQLGLLGIQCHIVDTLPQAGGQCTQLYPDKPIYDIPGVLMCSGQELVERLLQQLEPMQPQWHLGQHIQHVVRLANGRWKVRSTSGTEWHANTLFLTTGIGAFVPRALPLPALQAFAGRQMHYHPALSTLGDSLVVAGKDALVLGGDASAVACAVYLAELPAEHAARSITLLHRRAVLQADDASLSSWQALCDAGLARMEVGQPTGIETTHDGQLHQLHITDPEGESQALSADVVLAFPGLSPKLGPFADWGLDLERKQLPVDPATFATAQPGIYAAGDIVEYPGKRKLILCAFHEATQAAYAGTAFLQGEAPPLLYTTTSPRLHARLGVSHA